jgi:hypothetical protein
VTEERVRFETDVPGIWGYWPTTPQLWSYSSLKEIEACPRRWMLSRSDYPDLWSRRGYPAVPVVAAIFGNVVHSVIERLARTFADAGIISPTTGDAVGVLRVLGGWHGIVLDAIALQLSRFDGNPRVSSDRLDQTRDVLVRRAPEAADQVKALLRRGALPAAKRGKLLEVAGAAESRDRRKPAARGTHVEHEVTAEDLRLSGRIDLLQIDDVDVIITDFKTGEEDEAHADQVRLYALLWDRDREVNPERRPVTQLRVAYPRYERAVAVPDERELRELECGIVTRIAAADAVTSTRSPEALPGELTCQYCQVKHLCDSYWNAVPPSVAETSADEWFDLEVRAMRPQGSRSWYVETIREPALQLLVRTAETNVSFPHGSRLRLLGVRRAVDPDDTSRLVVSMSATSEWYVVRS